MPEPKPVNWNNRQAWPYGGADHKFVGEAIEVVGHYLFGAGWTGDEFWSGFQEDLLLEPSGAFENASDSRRYDAVKLLRHSHPDYAGVTENSLTAEMWTAAQSIYSEYREKRSGARTRLRGAKMKLRELCAHGELVAAYRWEIDGDHSQLEASRWNTEEFWTWLADGRVRGYYLFIERAGLDQLVGPPSIASAKTDPGFHQSEYLKFLYAAAARMNVASDDTRTAKVIQNQLLSLAEEMGRSNLITPNIAKNMATILRSPDAGGGKQSLTYKQRRNRA